MNNVFAVYKSIGVTPLAVINTLKKVKPEYINEKITYAGRLDPLAHGVLLLLVGDAIEKKEIYLNLPKTYEFEVILGVETDTYDVLGVVRNSKNKESDTMDVNAIVNTFVNEHIGMMQQAYPPYSSKTVRGKPLFWWAKHNKLHEIKIPQREIEIYDFEKIREGNISSEAFEKHIYKTIASVSGDFRQKEIVKCWKAFFAKNKQKKFKTLRFRVNCSSGTYVRSLAHELGKTLDLGAITFEILRTKVGNYTQKDALILAKS